jgi:hypothetical protein
MLNARCTPAVLLIENSEVNHAIAEVTIARCSVIAGIADGEPLRAEIDVNSTHFARGRSRHRSAFSEPGDGGHVQNW